MTRQADGLCLSSGPFRKLGSAGTSIAGALLILFAISGPGWADTVPSGEAPIDDLLSSNGVASSASTATKQSGESSDTDRQLTWHTVTVDSGDTLSRLLANEGISPATVHQLTQTTEHGGRLATLRPGEVIHLGLDADEALRQLVHEPSASSRLRFERHDEGFSSRETEIPLERRVHHASGTIRHSLMQAGNAAGLGDGTTLDLAHIFAWDIDFALDLRKGDRFHVIYESFYLDGDHVRDGAVLAAKFVNRGDTYRAVRYTDPDGDTDYFTPEGTSVRRAFLRAPVEYTRITSGFGPRRHPELHEIRDHTGVDYAAAPGTPIRATGDGRLVQRGWNGGYGRTVVIQHGERYRTLYAHLSRFRAGVDHGSRVSQGDIIGYVGESGLATGPHVHYEFLIDGIHRDPETVELPSGDPVPHEYRDHFAATASPLMAQLEALERTHAAAEQ